MVANDISGRLWNIGAEGDGRLPMINRKTRTIMELVETILDSFQVRMRGMRKHNQVVDKHGVRNGGIVLSNFNTIKKAFCFFL